MIIASQLEIKRRISGEGFEMFACCPPMCHSKESEESMNKSGEGNELRWQKNNSFLG